MYALRELYAPSGMIAGATALAGYVMFGPLLDRRFVADIRQIAAVRRRAAPAPRDNADVSTPGA
jgi:hypothetical protein